MADWDADANGQTTAHRLVQARREATKFEADRAAKIRLQEAEERAASIARVQVLFDEDGDMGGRE